MPVAQLGDDQGSRFKKRRSVLTMFVKQAQVGLRAIYVGRYA